MTLEYKKSVARFYAKVLEDMHRRPIKLPDTGELNVPAIEMLDHCLYMCYEIDKFLDQGRIDKADRWIGFIQGVFAAYNMYSIKEMAHHNRAGAAAAAGVE